VSGAIRLEKLGIPTLFLFAPGFEHDAEQAAIDNGMPTMRRLLVPGFVWGQPGEKKIPLAKASFDNMIDALTRPLTAEESKPKPKAKEVYPLVKITAATYGETVEKFNQVFLQNRWGDGLPLVPPTKEALKWMLTGTSRSPDGVLGNIPTQNGVATIEKIAVNAVMAGAKPEYLPVIIAAMEGLTDKAYDLLHPQASMGQFNLAVIVSGPIGEEINMNASTGFLGHGWRSNNTIGRAVRLSLLNLGHMWPGVNDMARAGRQSAHTLYTFAENQRFSPWAPYHVTQGHKPEDSSVTVSTIGGYGAYAVTTLGAVGMTAEMQLNEMIKSILDRREAVLAQYRPGVADPYALPCKYLFLIPPELAQNYQKQGFTRESLREYIYKKTSVPYEELSPKEIQSIKGRIDISIAGEGLVGGRIPPDRISVFQEALKPGGKVPIVVTPDDIHLFVVGYPVGGQIIQMSYHRAPYKWNSHQTKLIRGATLTKAGR